MRARFMIWIGAILLVAMALLGVGKCGYDKLGDLTSLEGKSKAIEDEFPDVEHISTGTLAALMQASEVSPLILIDSRAPEEFEVSHLKGALNFQTPEEVQSHLSRIRLSGPPTIAVYCSVGQRSAVLADQLQEAGLEGVKNVRGSIFAWANEDRPLFDSQNKVTEQVHPFNEFWGRLLKEEKRFDLDR